MSPNFSSTSRHRRLRPAAGACPICRYPALDVDEVDLDGALRLLSCPRCEHCHTERPEPVRALAAVSRLARAA